MCGISVHNYGACFYSDLVPLHVDLVFVRELGASEYRVVGSVVTCFVMLVSSVHFLL